MNQKTTSSKVIMAKIARDLKINLGSYEADFMEWIGEVLDYINYYPALQNEKKKLFVKDHRVLIPRRAAFVVTVYYNEKELPLKSKHKSYPYNSDDLQLYYFTTTDYINTSFESGEIEVNVLTYPVDDEGYPRIPDNVYFNQACEWYIMRQLKLGGVEFSNKEFSFEYLDYQWKTYCSAASNNLRYADYNKRMNFKEVWLKMVLPLDLEV